MSPVPARPLANRPRMTIVIRPPLRRVLHRCEALFSVLVCALFVGGLLAPRARAQDGDAEVLARELARLRSEVDARAAALAERREARTSRLRALAAQKAQVDAEVRREDLRARQLEESLATHRKRVEEGGAVEEQLRPVVEAMALRLGETVDVGVPFRVMERRQELARIRSDLKDGLILPSAALTRMWGWVEDELRQGRENSLHQQVITLGEREVLADVIHLGMVGLYFRTAEGELGVARREPAGAWRYAVLTERHHREQVAALFESLERRVRVGFFSLPTPMTTPVVSGGATP